MIAPPSIAVAAAPSLAKPDCPDYCGNVSIPYPFGIGSNNCYLDQRYAVTCNQSVNSSRPYLASLGLEVLAVSLTNQKITINNPVVKGCGNSPSVGTSKSLEGTPFVFSGRYNKFMVSGCGNATLDLDGIVMAGCSSRCNDDSAGQGKGCFGINCCETTTPFVLDRYNVSVTVSTQGECGFSELHRKLHHAPVSEKTLDYGCEPISCQRLCDCVNADGMKTGTHILPTVVKLCISTWQFHQGHTELDHGHFFWISAGVGISMGALFLIIGIFWLYKIVLRIKNKKRKEKFFKRNGGLLLQQQTSVDKGSAEKTHFSAKELEKATDNFNENRILGRGGQGTVFKGMLTDGRIVAVKKSKIVDESQLEQFINEVVILSQLNHRNVVKLLGCCLETEVPLLVYEFISNGTLFKHIHDQSNEFPLSWEMRLRIAIEVAGALAYLHSSTSIPIYHRDIKSTNILLDDKYKAKVSDFGTSRSIAIDQTHLTTLVKGTFGYLDPEYFQSSQFTEKSDVYSFGVVLVELLTGKKPISMNRIGEQRSLATHFLLSEEENCLFEIFDPRILKEGTKEELMAVANLAR
ncbi:hypothetical protein RJ640_008699, partial [Escallonia rubra]